MYLYMLDWNDTILAILRNVCISVIPAIYEFVLVINI